MGASYNASTYIHWTNYYERGPKHLLNKLLAMEASRMAKLDLKDSIVAEERKVIMEERYMRLNNKPSAMLSNKILTALFEAHPMGRPVIGWEQDMRSLNTEDYLEWHRQYYAPNNAILIITGDFDIHKTKAEIEKQFGSIPARKTVKRVKWTEPLERGVHKTLTLKDQRVQQPRFQWAVHADSYSYGDPKLALAAGILSDALFMPEIGLVHKELVGRQKIVTSISGVNDASVPMGYFWITAIPAPGISTHEIANKLNALLKQISEDGISAEMIEKIKNRIINAQEYEKDSIFGIAHSVGETLIADLPLDFAMNSVNYLKTVTAADVNKVLRETLLKRSAVEGHLLPDQTAKS